MVLDEITASKGVVCAIVGSSCCTYIPPNDADGGAIHQVLQNLTALQDSLYW